MKDTKWLAGAFSAYGLCDIIGRTKPKVSLFTSSEHAEYARTFTDLTGFGTVKPFRGRWHWTCDSPSEVQQFHIAVGPHLIAAKREMIEAAWEEWRRQTLDKTDGAMDPGPIDGPLYPELQQDADIAP